MGGEVGMSAELVKKCLDHPQFPDDFGIDTFLTTVALANEFKIHGGILDAKFHESTSKYIEPKKHLLGMFRQVTKALFDLMIYYEKEWKRRKPLPFHEAKRPRKLDRYKGPRPTPVSLDVELLWNAGNEIIEGKKRLLKEITGEDYEELLGQMTGKSHLGRYASFVESTRYMNLNVAELDVHKQMLYFLNERDLLMDIF
jgi:hypothetical protein